MNLLYTDVEDQLRASVRDLLADKAKPADVLARCETGAPYDLALWRELAELGATSLLVPEELGGQGAGRREMAVVLEELGRSVAPVPFLGSAVLAGVTLLGCAPTDAVRALLAGLATGSSTPVLAVSLATAPESPFYPQVGSAGLGDGRLALTGRIRTVADAAAADVLLVPFSRRLFTVPVAQDGVTITPAVSLDLTRPVADIILDHAVATELSDRAWPAVRSALWTAAGLLASEQVGLAEWCLSTTVAYLKERYQFGRPVGSFQALKHRLADLWQELVLARATARHAADAADADDAAEARIAAGIAQSLCATVAVHAAEECVQLHGGIGMTWEHPAHLYLKRAKANSIALGTAEAHRALLAPMIDLPGKR